MMRKKLSISLVLTIAFAGPIVFGATEAGAVCSVEDAADFKCFSNNGREVHIVPGTNGEFPVIDEDGNSVFAYHAKKLSPIKFIGVINETVSKNCGAGKVDPVIEEGAPPAFELIEDIAGHPITEFGKNQDGKNVASWSRPPFGPSDVFFSLTVQGERAATNESMEVTSQLNIADFSFGTIQGPGCESAQEIDERTECYTADERTICVEKDELGNAKNVQFCDAGENGPETCVGGQLGLQSSWICTPEDDEIGCSEEAESRQLNEGEDYCCEVITACTNDSSLGCAFKAGDNSLCIYWIGGFPYNWCQGAF